MDLRKRTGKTQAWAEFVIRFRWILLPIMLLLVLVLGANLSLIEKSVFDLTSQLNKLFFSALNGQFVVNWIEITSFVLPIFLLVLIRLKFEKYRSALYFLFLFIGYIGTFILLNELKTAFPAIIMALMVIAVTGIIFSKSAWLIGFPVLLLAIFFQFSWSVSFAPLWTWLILVSLLHLDILRMVQIMNLRLKTGHTKQGSVVWGIKGTVKVALVSSVFLIVYWIVAHFSGQFNPWTAIQSTFLAQVAVYFVISQIITPIILSLFPFGRVLANKAK